MTAGTKSLPGKKKKEEKEEGFASGEMLKMQVNMLCVAGYRQKSAIKSHDFGEYLIFFNTNLHSKVYNSPNRQKRT